MAITNKEMARRLYENDMHTHQEKDMYFSRGSTTFHDQDLYSITNQGTNTYVDNSNSIIGDAIANRSTNVVLTDSTSIDIGDGVVLSGKTLKTCLKVLLDLAMREYPEDFV